MNGENAEVSEVRRAPSRRYSRSDRPSLPREKARRPGAGSQPKTDGTRSVAAKSARRFHTGSNSTHLPMYPQTHAVALARYSSGSDHGPAARSRDHPDRRGRDRLRMRSESRAVRERDPRDTTDDRRRGAEARRARHVSGGRPAPRLSWRVEFDARLGALVPAARLRRAR